MKRIWWLGVLGILVGCGGGSSSPAEKCDDLVDVVCDRAVECTTVGVTHSDCVDEIQSVLSCGSAMSVSASYDRCMDQLDSNSCASLFPDDPDTGEPSLELPADCNAVILTREGGTSPATGWNGLAGANGASTLDR